MVPEDPTGDSVITGLPVLYSFRRCPFALRARMAVCYSGIRVELREVLLRDLPEELLACSPKGTVPVMVLPDGRVLEESLDIMLWALARHDPDGWWPGDAILQATMLDWIGRNDTLFKPDLDRYKYAVRYPEHPPSHYRAQGEHFLLGLERQLQLTPWLCLAQPGLADHALFPFVRQFAQVDAGWFAAAPYPRVRAWLARLTGSQWFAVAMRKYPRWVPGNASAYFP